MRRGLEIGSALDAARLPATLERLGDSRDGDVIRCLYRDGLDLAQASQDLGMTKAELRTCHRTALEAIKKTVLQP
jgi:hypothetical protein